MNNFPKIGLGTFGYGGWTEPDPNNDDEQTIKVIQTAIKMGLTHIDTAQVYAAGKTEELVGKAIKPFDRKTLFIASKVSDKNLGYVNVVESCKESLKRLGISYLDLYYIHRPNPKIPYKETARALNELLDKGLIKEVGICNVSVETLKQYQKYLKQPVFAVQNNYSLIVRESVKKGVMDYCRKKGIHFIAWRPIQMPVPEIGIESLAKKGAYPFLDKLAEKYGKTNAQIAVRWLTQQDNVSILFKSNQVQHLKEIIETKNFELTKEDMRILEKDFPLQKDSSFQMKGNDWPII